MSKTIAFCPLFYGASYFKEAADSVAPHADLIHVLYTRQPSFGHRTTLRNPDSEESLRACVEHLGDQVEWHIGQWGSEGQHRDAIMAIAPDADIILPFDSDEIWSQTDIVRCIEEAKASTARNFLIQGWFHFWRSLGWANSDTWAPVRIIRPRGHGDATLHGTVFHCGYAISPELVAFKQSCHGHKSEWRPRWFEDIFMAWPERKTDLHPTTKLWWNALPFRADELPQCLREHPNFGKEVIR